MKERVLSLFRKIYYFKDKIAFYPSIFGFFGCLFAYMMMVLENYGISKYLIEFLPELVINDGETARTILATFIAGLISIMVFSFSMVMILLNQASSNFSPRLLPGLISNTRHQIILGIYIATILYCIFILVFIEPTGDKYQLPGFSVLLSIILMVLSLASFIYFIHSISQEIQISNIMSKIYNSAKNNLNIYIEAEKNKDCEFPNSDDWTVYKSKKSGYIQDVSSSILAKIASKEDCKINIITAKGSFVNKEQTLFKTEKKLDEDTLDRIYENFDFSRNEFVEDNYILAFKQLTEVAVKSMSPGINDPGTALNAIDYLSELLLLRVKKEDQNITFRENKPLVLIDSINFDKLLYQMMLSLRTYCKHDAILMKKMLDMLQNLLQKCKKENYATSIKKEINNLLIDAKQAIKNERDLEILEKFSS